MIELDQLTQRLKEIDEYLTPPPIYSKTVMPVSYVREQVALTMPKMTHYSLDSTYFLCNQTDFMNLVLWDWTNLRPYIAEIHDCENFTFEFMVSMHLRFGLNGVGFIGDYSSGHAYNVVIFPTGKPMLFEPQTDSLYMVGEQDPVMYGLDRGVILL